MAEQVLDLDVLCKKFGIAKNTMRNALPHNLDKIYTNFCMTRYDLGKYQSELLNLMHDLLRISHSLRSRIKDPEHLVEKVIRNVASRPQKYKIINDTNYYKIITDLIGFRIILLSHNDWRPVHEKIISLFTNDPTLYIRDGESMVEYYDRYSEESIHMIEQPTVYVTSSVDRLKYEGSGLRVDNSKEGYSSIHYVIRYKMQHFEIQVRTLFEEGWLEFDHKVLYPHDQGNEDKKILLAILANMATAADRLITFYDVVRFEDKAATEDDENVVIPDPEEVKPPQDFRHRISSKY